MGIEVVEETDVRHDATASAPPKRLALLVCNGVFTHLPSANLDGPEKDAATLGAVLANPELCGFDVRTVVNGGLREVRMEIARLCRDADEEDTIVLYFSGSGSMAPNGTFHLLMTDTDPEFLHATGLDAEFVLSQLRGSRCRQIVLLIDGAYSGAFFAMNRGVPNGMYAMTACGADKYCRDTSEGGMFTLALADGLRNAAADFDGDGQVSIDELHAFVTRKLSNELQGTMFGLPQKWVWNVPNPIYLASAPSPVFLSYAREDSAIADQLTKALEAEGLSVWIDRQDIESGSWKERVMAGLSQARATVFLMSPDSLSSDPVRKELAFAANRSVPIIPVQIGGVRNEGIPDWYILDFNELHRHAIDPTAPDREIAKLASAIRGARQRSATANAQQSA